MLTGRSYDQAPPGRRQGTRALALASVLLLSLAGVASMASGVEPVAPSQRTWPPEPYPSGQRVDAARAFAEAAPGTVAFAVVDANRGVRGLNEDAQFSSASVSKALLLAAELRRLAREGEGIDAGTRSLLDSMITYSDNDAASAVYARVGDGAMQEVAEGAGMSSFEVTPGYWGGAQVTAADLARFFYGLDRNLPARHRAYGKRLLANITSTQRWGIPEGAGGGWTVYFKGGWRPAGTTETSGPVTHQAALLVHRTGQRIGIAILTDQSPGSTSYATLEGITDRLLRDDPAGRRWPAP
jgi:Beta-lactamase enzyme family